MKACFNRIIPLALPLLFGLMPMPSLAADAASSVSVSDPYVRAVPPGQPNSAAFMQMRNSDAVGHSIMRAESPVAKIVELHTHIKEGGMMKMRQVKQIDIPAHGDTVLQPGGLHVMLIGLKGDLTPGENVDVTLIFEDGSKKLLQAQVRKIKMKMDMKQNMH